MLLNDLLTHHYAVHRLLSRGYFASIKSAISSLSRHLGRPPTLDDLSDETLHALAHAMLDGGLSRASVNRVRRTLCALVNYARRKGWIDYRPDLDRVPETHPRPICWKPEELARLVEAIHRLYGRTEWGPLLFALVGVYYDTGMRMSDALRIERAECDLRRGLVRYTEQKTGKRRPFILHADTIAAIIRLGLRGERLIPYRYRETQPLRRRLRRALIAAGLPHGPRDLFQKIRRTTASLGMAAGIDPREILGHSSRWVTDTYYVDTDHAPPLDVANHLPRLPSDDRHERHDSAA